MAGPEKELSRGWRTPDLVVVGLGAALVVFFAGVAAVLAAGHTAPTEMWAAGGAVSGGLIGLLLPQPTPRSGAVAGRPAPADAERAGGRGPAAGGLPPIAGADGPPAAGAPDAAGAAGSGFATPRVAAVLLLLFFVALLALGIVLAAGAILPPHEFVQSLQSVTTAVVALASAAGSALIGLFAPTHP